MSSITKDQKRALEQLLRDMEVQSNWDYYKRGGWAGAQIYDLVENGIVLADPLEKKEKPAVWLTEEQVRGLFSLAGIEILKVFKIENEYWPDSYVELRQNSPWFLVQTPKGMIKIGWRKNVISIDWDDTHRVVEVTTDNVTKSGTSVHAWSFAKALEYLSVLGASLRKG